jgi:hypothetical protein
MTGEPSDLTLSLMCDRVHSAMATPHHVERAPGQPGEHRVQPIQLGVSVESMRLELDVHKASTALAQIDEFVARARAASRAARQGTAAAHPTLPVGAPMQAVRAMATAAPFSADTFSADTAPSPIAARAPSHEPREEAALASRRTPAPTPAAAAPLTIERIHLESLPDEDE